PNLVMPEVADRLRLAAVCGVVEERARATAERFGASHVYTSQAELAEDPDVDIVAVGTPNPHHLAAGMVAIQAGKHIYMQKTMTLTVAEADELIEAASRSNIKIAAAPGNHLRSRPLAEIRELIRSGKIGKVCWGSAAKGTRHEDDARRNDDPGANVDPSWYYRPSGGPLRDAAIYDLHTLTWLLGPARKIMAMSGVALPERHWNDHTIDVSMDDNTHFVLDFGESCFVVVSSHFIKQSSLTPALELYGEHGAIVMGGGASGSYELFGEGVARDRHGLSEQRLKTGDAPEPGADVGLRSNYVADVLHLADCVLEDRQPATSAAHARHCIEIIEKVYESARFGCTMDLRTTFPWEPM
ncbi:MAG: Gfo/Idh/MocA family protein, partial [Chloroflexota bacterium]